MKKMNEVSLIFPHQLFRNNPCLTTSREVFMMEDPLFFNQYHFHKMKLVLHRASMKHFKKELEKRGFDVNYQEVIEGKSLSETLLQLKRSGIERVHYSETCDYLIERRLLRTCAKLDMKLVCYPTPNFLRTSDYLNNYFDTKKRYFLTEFYIEQRKSLKILYDGKEPEGGQWTFDTDNRKKIPSHIKPPALQDIGIQPDVAEAIEYVNNNFPTVYGTTDDFLYPITEEDALLRLDDFLQNRFQHFGVYQDAIDKENSFLFHSLISSSLNIGLLTPEQIVDRAIKNAAAYRIPINSLEGFIRQVIGWREFIRAVYQREGVRQRTHNHWNHKRKIPSSFWKGTTGIEPVDDVIRKVLKTGYCHHIERLMVVGNFMLLCEFDPDDVYRWFMELFIDSYDWVMVPNVYGMSQFADGGRMSTKPYISGSNYILKMSNYSKGHWCEIWDALYWRFIDLHQDEFMKNPRMTMMVRQLEKIPEARWKHLTSVAKKYLVALDEG